MNPPKYATLRLKQLKELDYFPSTRKSSLGRATATLSPFYSSNRKNHASLKHFLEPVLQSELTVFFLHGGPGLKDYLEPFFRDAFSNAPIKTYFYSQKPAKNIDDLVEELTSKIEEIKPEQFVLFGHSGGGPISLEYVKRHKTRAPLGMILMSSPFTTDFDHEFAEKVTAQQIAAEQLLLSPFERRASEAQDFLSRVMQNLDLETFNAVYADYFAKLNLTEFCSQINLPVLMISGSEDGRVSVDHQKKHGFSAFKNCQFVEIPEAGHFPFLLPQHCEKVVSAVLNFLYRNAKA